MELIDKDALVAEIVRRKEINKYRDTNDSLFEDEAILSFINTLQVKEVDLELTLKDISMIRQIMFDYNRQIRNEMSIPNDEDYCKEVLKRLKAQKGE